MNGAIDRYSVKIYSMITSKDFPLILALVYLSAFIVDITYTLYVLFQDKSYFLIHESNALLKYSLTSGNWFVYPTFAILFYSTLVFISKKYTNPAIRSLFLVMGALQLGTPLKWAFSTEIFVSFYIFLFLIIHYPLIRFSSKNKKEGTPKGAKVSSL